MIEMGIVLVLGAVVLMLVIAWVSSLVNVTVDGTQRTTLAQSTASLTGLLGTDLAQAQSCSPSGDGPVLAYLNAFSSTSDTQDFGLFTLNDPSATPSDPALVIWTFVFDPSDPSTVETVYRTDLGPVASGCATPAPPTGFNAATNAASQVVFSGPPAPVGTPVTTQSHLSGVGGPDPGYTGSCTASTADALDCGFSGLNLGLTTRSPSGLPDTLDLTLPIQTASVRL